MCTCDVQLNRYFDLGCILMNSKQKAFIIECNSVCIFCVVHDLNGMLLSFLLSS